MTRDEIEEFSGVDLNCFETDREEDWYKIGCIDGLKAADTEPILQAFGTMQTKNRKKIQQFWYN